MYIISFHLRKFNSDEIDCNFLVMEADLFYDQVLVLNFWQQRKVELILRGDLSYLLDIETDQLTIIEQTNIPKIWYDQWDYLFF